MDDFEGCYLDKIPLPTQDCFVRSEDFDAMEKEVQIHNKLVAVYNFRVSSIELEMAKMEKNYDKVMDSWKAIIEKFPKDIKEKYKTQIKEAVNDK